MQSFSFVVGISDTVGYHWGIFIYHQVLRITLLGWLIVYEV